MLPPLARLYKRAHEGLNYRLRTFADGRSVGHCRPAQLEAMIPYFRRPDSLRLSIQPHSAHERRQLCSARTTLQIQANGDVTVCVGLPSVGNITALPIRRVWESRPRAWKGGCCLYARCSEAERDVRLLRHHP